ncbi:MAG: hypothetical protein R3D63_07315 [Paracoccaceae bacterium]
MKPAPPLPGDLILLARLVSASPRHHMRRTARRILDETLAAHLHRIATGQAHPRLGDGSLAGRIMCEDLPPLALADHRDFLTALRIVAEEILKHTAR